MKPSLDDLSLSASLEDYLEAILVLSREKKAVRVRDIALKLNVSMSSVNGALKRLTEQKLARHERYEYVELTPEGALIAQKILDRHNLLLHFLSDILHVPVEQAEKESCAIEHHLSQETIDRILDFIFFIDVCPKGVESWKNIYEKCLQGECTDDNCSLRKLRPEGRHIKVSGKEIPLTLKHIKPGFSVKVKKITAKGNLRKRLLDMGFSPGILMYLQRVAPLGDPIEVKVRGFNLSLRKNEADFIEVELV
ncbi:DtxR family transcriptional regulator [Candidatus Sumerlaeota bacterium]|nr:DtxR family transcriptional regulator [Candidatus Sumerlaeota bacterium]